MRKAKSFNATAELGAYLQTQVAKACQPTVTSAGLGNVPFGFRSLAIVKTSPNTDTVTITLSDGTTYQMKEYGEIFADAADDGRRLPAYVIAGPGTWKWHGIRSCE